MSDLTAQRISAYRAETYRLTRRVTTPEEAIAFVNERGFTFFWPIKNVTLPSLWVAVAGDRPVPNEHDDPGMVTWGWKDSLLGERRWYYAKVLRKRATFIALEMAPYFYALSANYGSPEEDYLDQYRRGELTQAAKAIYEALLHEGPLHTIALRKATFMGGKKSAYRFERALAELQADFKILPVRVARAGAWHYAFTYDCVHRHYPDLPERARHIGIAEARRTLMAAYFRSVGAAQVRDVLKVCGWPPDDVERTLAQLAAAGLVIRGLELAGQRREWIALPELCREQKAPG